MNKELINDYLKRLSRDGWDFYQGQAANQLDWWFVRRKTSRRSISIYVGRTAECLTWQLPVIANIQPGCHTAVYRLLLLLNHDVCMVKFSLDAAGLVHLTAELPPDAVNFSAFRSVFMALQIYFEQYQREIELLASNSDLAEAWIALLPTSEEAVVAILQ